MCFLQAKPRSLRLNAMVLLWSNDLIVNAVRIDLLYSKDEIVFKNIPGTNIDMYVHTRICHVFMQS